MCTIDKMLIKGIRAFSPENTAVITFYRPLTLIVGPNGAGKTTIIECLKHACTGELPPNSRSGQTFIHDPKVAGETEVKGQIKLRFKTAAGKDVVCIRSFQLSQKASKLEYKAIESVLQTINSNTGEKICLSYRCADMDREVPALMGVSKAILENVIFVHQDEANWPLSEGAVLKRKFDDIFSSTRYTKALEVIKKLHKDQAQLIKEYKLKKDHLQTLKDGAFRLQEGINGDRDKANHLKSQMRHLEEKIIDVREKISEAEAELKRVRNLQEQIRVKEGRREVLLTLKAQQYHDITEEIDDVDEELLAWQERFKSDLGTLKMNIAKTERDLNDVKTQNLAEKENYNKCCTVKGRLQAEAEAHIKDKKERDFVLQGLYAKHNLGEVGDLPLTHDSATKWTGRAIKRLEELHQNFAQLQAANRAEHQSLTGARETAQAKLVEATGHIRLLVNQKKDLQNESQVLERTVETLALSEADVMKVEQTEKSTKEAADSVAVKLREKQYDTHIDEAKADLYKLEQKIKSLQREKDGLAAESGERVSLKMKKEALNAKESSMNKLVDGNKEKFRKALGGRLPERRTLLKEIEKVVSANDNSYQDLDSQAKKTGQDVAALTMRLQDARNDLASKKRDRDTKRRFLSDRLFATVQKQVEADTLEEQLASATKAMEGKKREHDLLDGMRRCFSRFMELAQADQECPVCERAFQTPQEIDSFMQKQRKKQSESADKLRLAASQKLELEARTKALDQLRPIFLEYNKLTKEGIPASERNVADVEDSLQKATENHDDLLGLLGEMKNDHYGVKQLESVAKEVDRLLRETQALQKEVEDGVYKLDVMSQGLRTMEDVNSELTSLEEKRDDMTRKVEKLREEQQYMKDDFTSWNLRWRNAREEKMNMTNRLTKLKDTKASAKKITEQLRHVEMDMETWEQKLKPLQKEVEKLLKEQETQNNRAGNEENLRHSEVRAFERDLDQLQSINVKIEHYMQSGKETELKKVLDKISRSQSAQQSYEKQERELSETLSEAKERLENQASIKRNIDDNVQYRNTLKEERAMVAEIESLQEQIVGSGDVETVEKEMKVMINKLQGWEAEKNRSQGTTTAYESNINRNRMELKAPQYKDIDNRYRHQLIQLRTTEMANKDLDKYYSALDRALMRFHSMKMEEINKIIKELWQQTYRGQDIDFIEIRSDAEGIGTRSYSYRVVMRAGDAELDMRGRCSAGQKVLASLVIRLALAETFCLNCGILALDEPTTNLDSQNAESLAGALLRIMDDRRGQENFQLIIITHDESFAQMIGRRQHAERYFRISKDEHQHSRIEVQDIYD